MALLRAKRIVNITVEFEDGQIEQWDFPVPITYRERTNTTTENDPVKSQWVEHDIHWRSDILKEVKVERRPG